MPRMRRDKRENLHDAYLHAIINKVWLHDLYQQAT